MNLQADIVRLITAKDPAYAEYLIQYVNEIQNPSIKKANAINRLIECIERDYHQKRERESYDN